MIWLLGFPPPPSWMACGWPETPENECIGLE
jgi:hypothetical protein